MQGVGASMKNCNELLYLKDLWEYMKKWRIGRDYEDGGTKNEGNELKNELIPVSF